MFIQFTICYAVKPPSKFINFMHFQASTFIRELRAAFNSKFLKISFFIHNVKIRITEPLDNHNQCKINAYCKALYFKA